MGRVFYMPRPQLLHLSLFYYYDKTSRSRQLTERKVYLAYGSRGAKNGTAERLRAGSHGRWGLMLRVHFFGWWVLVNILLSFTFIDSLQISHHASQSCPPPTPIPPLPRTKQMNKQNKVKPTKQNKQKQKESCCGSCGVACRVTQFTQGPFIFKCSC